MQHDYAAFLESKRLVTSAAGFEVAEDAISPKLFPFQRRLVQWGLRKGRCALLADTGLGKTWMQVEWARLVNEHTGRPILILAPLAVAQQTQREAEKLGVEVRICRKQADVWPGLNIVNYEMLSHMDPATFGGVVLDESSILKSFEGKTRSALIKAFAQTPYRLCCTATPAPNDIAEIANHAEFLGVMSRVEMLAAFFVHDDEGWRLKGHAREPFYRWLASWGMSLKKPSDLGFDDTGYDLPPLTIQPVIVPSEYTPDGMLFATHLRGITDRAATRRGTLEARVQAAVDLIAAEPDEPWLVWCGLNDEANAVERSLPAAAVVQVEGSQSPDEKVKRLQAFLSGERRILVSKVAICGHGLNFQHCARVLFVGLSDSYESYYQAIRRCWRFGQTRPVQVFIVLTDLEEAIYENVLRKEQEATAMGRELIKHVAEFERAELGATRTAGEYAAAQPMRLPAWLRQEVAA